MRPSAKPSEYMLMASLQGRGPEQEPFLKWLDLWKLGQIIIPNRTEELVKVVFLQRLHWRSPQES